MHLSHAYVCLHADDGHKGESMGTIWQTMKKGYLRVIIAGAIVWPPAQMVNFLVVPLPYRVLFINVVGLAWSTYTSFVASRGYDRRVLPLPPIINPLYHPTHKFNGDLQIQSSH